MAATLPLTPEKVAVEVDDFIINAAARLVENTLQLRRGPNPEELDVT